MNRGFYLHSNASLLAQTVLACIAHKFLDQPATLRPPASLREALRARRSDADGEFVNDAASGSPELRNTSRVGAFEAAFWREHFKDSLFQLRLF